MTQLSRRRFVQNATLASQSMILADTQASGKATVANDRMRIVATGLNGRGKSHISGWLEGPNVENYILGAWLRFDVEKEVYFGNSASKANLLMKEENRKRYQLPELTHV